MKFEFKAGNFKVVFNLVLVIMTIVASLMTIFFKFYTSKRDDQIMNMKIEEQQYILKHELVKYREIQDSLKLIIQDYELKLNASTKNIDSSIIVYNNENRLIKIEKELTEINSSFNKLSDDYKGLRQALNPIKPDEVLTIARLKDEILSLQEQFVDFEKNLETKQNEFKNYIIRERESSDKATNLILVILIPLILNFLYTVWKDFKEDKKDGNTKPNNV